VVDIRIIAIIIIVFAHIILLCIAYGLNGVGIGKCENPCRGLEKVEISLFRKSEVKIMIEKNYVSERLSMIYNCR